MTLKKHLHMQIKIIKEITKGIDGKFFMLAFLEALFFLSSFIVIYAWSKTIGAIASKTLGLDLSAEQEILPILQQKQELISGFMTKFLLLTVLAFLIWIAVYTLFRGIIWTRIVKKKFSAGYYGKYYVLNFVFSIIAAIIIILLSNLIMAGMLSSFGLFVVYSLLFYLIMLLLMVIKAIIDLAMAKKQEIKKAMHKTWKAVKKLHYFITPVIAVIILTAVTSIILSFIKIVLPILELILSAVTLLLIITWARYYFARVFDEI